MTNQTTTTTPTLPLQGKSSSAPCTISEESLEQYYRGRRDVLLKEIGNLERMLNITPTTRTLRRRWRKSECLSCGGKVEGE